MRNGFGALMHRMNYINRWGLMRNSRSESLAEHSLSCAFIAHILACIANTRFDADVDVEQVVCCAMYHDAAEILTGDMPTPVKYNNERVRDEVKKIEKVAQRHLIAMLPNDIAELASPAVTMENLSQREKEIIKASDKLCALIKCLEEEAAGNTEFSSAKRSTIEILESDPLPETRLFLDEFIPAYSLTLDELMAL